VLLIEWVSHHGVFEQLIYWRTKFILGEPQDGGNKATKEMATLAAFFPLGTSKQLLVE